MLGLDQCQVVEGVTVFYNDCCTQWYREIRRGGGGGVSGGAEGVVWVGGGLGGGVV